jgi:hypothetical protein
MLTPCSEWNQLWSSYMSTLPIIQHVALGTGLPHHKKPRNVITLVAASMQLTPLAGRLHPNILYGAVIR